MNKQILRLAIPNIISNLSVPLLSAVDMAVLGHLDQIYYLGALAVGGIIFNFVYWGFGFLRMSTTGMTAQAVGNQAENETTLILLRAAAIAVLSGILLIFVQTAIAHVSFLLVEATPQVEKYAREYFHIRIWAAPATLMLFALQGWFLGMQNAKYPLILTVLVNGANILLNFAFVYGLEMRSEGVAYATVIAQYAGLLTGVYLYFRKYPTPLLKKLASRIVETAALKRVFLINFDIFLRTIGLIFAFSYFTAKSAESGDDILAANSILLQFIMILAYGVDGFAFAAESLVGKHIGAGDESGLRLTVRYSFYWGMALAGVVALTYVGFGENILFIFTNKAEIVALCMQFITWVLIAPFIHTYCFIWDGVFVGATATAAMRNSTLFCAFGIFLPTHLLLRDQIGNHSLWLALTLFMVMRGLTLAVSSKQHVYGQVASGPAR